jgi:spermidine/putrescine transport system ATP-binding protein
LDGLTKRFGDLEAVTDVSATVGDGVPEGDAVQLSLRPGFLGMEERSDRRAATDGGYSVEGTLENVLYQGSSVRYSVAAGETRVFVERHVQHHTDLDPGAPVRLQVDAEDVLLFHEDGRRIDAW